LVACFERADVVMHNLGPDAVERLGFGREATETRWPHLVTAMRIEGMPRRLGAVPSPGAQE